MRIAAFILSGAALAGCAVQPQSASVREAQRCISAAGVSGRYVLPPNSIMFEMAGRGSYRNVLARPCPGLARLGRTAGIVFEDSTGRQICSGDRVRLFDSLDNGPSRLAGAPLCQLGRFVPFAR